MRRNFVLGLGLLTVVVILTAPVLADASKEFAAFAKAWQDAYNAKDAAAVAALYAENGTIMPPNAPTATGRSAIEAYLKTEIAAATGKLTIKYTDSETHGELGYSHGTYAVTDDAGNTLDTGKWIEVRKKVSGKWMIQYDIWNSDMKM